MKRIKLLSVSLSPVSSACEAVRSTGAESASRESVAPRTERTWQPFAMANELRRAAGLSALAVMLSSLAGCSGVLMARKPIPAANPLEGAVLRISMRPGDQALNTLGPGDCSAWPVEDRFAVHVEGGRVCLDVTRFISVGSALDDAASVDGMFEREAVSIATNTGSTGPLTLAAQGGASKVAHCRAATAIVDVWTRTVSGCTSNTPQLLTPSTQWLSVRRHTIIADVDDARWTFPVSSTTVITSARATPALVSTPALTMPQASTKAPTAPATSAKKRPAARQTPK